MATPEFIERDVNVIINEMVADYEQRTGKTLQPAQVERLLINAFAYREALVREKVQYAALQNLVEYANAPVLDELGRLVGVTRLAASAATCEIQLTFVNDHGDLTVPSGLRIASQDGLAVFTLDQDLVVVSGEDEYTVTATCNSTGTVGNGYLAGSIYVILDPQPYLSAASNISNTGGGAAQETDSALRERIKLAPSAFSNAGSKGAYKYFAKSASPSIIDVAVFGTEDGALPGEVKIFPLMEDGSVTPDTILDAVFAACNVDKIRPLNDLVTVNSPDRINYTVEVDVEIYTDADPTDIQSAIESKLATFTTAKRKTLGQDIVMSQLISQCMIDGVFNVSLASPLSNIGIDGNEFGFCTAITVNIAGSTNG